MIEVFQTNRLIFKAWETTDGKAFLSLCQRTGLGDFGSSTYQNPSLETADEFVKIESNRFRESGSCKFAVVLKETAELIGISGIFEMDPPFAGCFEINYRFCRDYWGMGLGCEAAKAMIDYGFSRLKLDRIYAIVRIENIHSERVLEKVGMSVEREIEWRGFQARLWSLGK